MKGFLFATMLLSSMSALAADNGGDKSIYEALSVNEVALPTAYPVAGFQKTVGRLACRHMINTQTQEESYVCTLAD